MWDSLIHHKTIYTMRASDLIVRFIIAVLLGLFIYFFVEACRQIQAVDDQQPNRPSVASTMDDIDTGKAATLDAEDYDEEGLNYDADRALSNVKDGANSAGETLKGGVNSLKDGVSSAGNAIKDGASTAGNAIKESAGKYIPTSSSINDLVASKEAEAKAREASDEARTNEGRSSTPQSYGSVPDGAYMVVAGTFKQMINAEQALRKYKNMGYENASIAKFNKSAYASLIVDRFNSSSEAKSYANTLKKKGLEAYVHKKR